MTLALVVAAVTLVSLLLFVGSTEHRPEPVEEVPVECTGGGDVGPRPHLAVGRPFRLVSWNLQFGAGRKHQFFYDGGDAVHVPKADVDEAVKALQRALAAYAPDVALLQEIDRDSDRTHRIDQLPLLAGAAGAGADCTAAATYHRSPLVPSPMPVPLGRVDMNLGIFTRGPLTGAKRLALPLLDESRLRQAFNLKRAVLAGQAPIDGHPLPLRLAVTHLSAFSHGDGTLERQVAVLAKWMEEQSDDPAQPWILAGDFNLLPPGDDPARLTVESSLYADAKNPIEELIPRFRTLFPVADLLAEQARSYVPYGADAPDRKIDFVFIGGPIEVVSARVGREHIALSDHLPLVADLKIVPRN
jgi:endonuclease/exonuclease/phosphatase family metal-dependent hydrolase